MIEAIASGDPVALGLAFIGLLGALGLLGWMLYFIACGLRRKD